MSQRLLKSVATICTLVGLSLTHTISVSGQTESVWRRGQTSNATPQSSGQQGARTSAKGASSSRTIPPSPQFKTPSPGRTAASQGSPPSAGRPNQGRTNVASSETDPPPLQSVKTAAELDARKLEKDRRYRELQNRIQALLKRDQQTQPLGAEPLIPEAQPHEAQPHEAQSDSHVPPVDSHPVEPGSDESPAHETPSHDLHPSPERSAESHSPGTPPINTHTPDTPSETPASDGEYPIGSHMVDGPIDRVAAADSLYLVGEFGLSLKMYESIDVSTLGPDEENWIALQIAGCLRKLGRKSEAQQKYRHLAATPEAGKMNELARWWLQQMNERTELEANLKRYENLIQSQKEALNGTRGK
ncbi:MAG: hypothetical protein JNL58_16600 [Planctomyces sp.]|nr:hypothetical protein [Planctomyces sp.]